MPRTFRRAKLAQRLGFDLPDALTGNVKFLTDLFESMLALAADAEAQPDDFLFFRRQGLQNVGGLIAHVGIDYRVDGRTYPAVFDQISQRGFAVAADRSFKRHRIARNGFQLLDLLDRNVHAAADFVVGRHASQFLFELASCAQELVHALVHVHRNANGAGLVGDGARYGLTDPPSGISGKFVAAPVFKFVGGAHQADVAFLNQVQQVETAVHVFL